MSNNSSTSTRVSFNASVVSNTKIRQQFYRLKLNLPKDALKAFAEFQPGQFAQLDISGTALPQDELIPADLQDVSGRNILLRRPFSFSDVNVNITTGKGTAEIVYRVIGPSTLRMTTLASGNSVGVIGPLGKGFSVPEGKKMALLVAGGIGVPPLQHLAKYLTANFPRTEAIAFVGAKTLADLPYQPKIDEVSRQLGFSLPEFTQYGMESLIATDDGSSGYNGLVTDCLLDWLQKSDYTHESMIIYSCGPEPMLAKVAEIAEKKNIDCQVSMERQMACGIGLCQSCSVECKTNNNGQTIYKLCCQDGPVFDSRKVVFRLSSK
jgi:dihydroorotate dehydrogenase electron transfer subunit